MTSRRQFLAGAAAIAAAPLVPEPAFAQRHLLLGLQLYTVRADLAKDYEGTLKQVKAAGVRKVQANLTNSGKSAPDQRKLYDSMGLIGDRVPAGGDDLRNTPQATIDQAKAVGIKNITCSFPLYPADRATIMKGPTVDDWKKNIDAFNKLGALCKKSGLTFA